MSPSAHTHTHTTSSSHSALSGSGYGYATPSAAYDAYSSSTNGNLSRSNASASFVDDHASYKSGSRGRVGPLSSSNASFATWGEGAHHSSYVGSASTYVGQSTPSVTSWTPSTPCTPSSPAYIFRNLSHLSRSPTPLSLHPLLSSPSSSGLSLDLLRPLPPLPLPPSTLATSHPKTQLVLCLRRISQDLFLVVQPHSSHSVTVSDVFATLSTFLLSPLSHPSELARLPSSSQKIGSESFHARTAGDSRSYKRGMIWGDCLERGGSRFGGLVYLGTMDGEAVWELSTPNSTFLLYFLRTFN
ncbi:hypothetical protein VKT23_010127 [Stygiomarasmius scandens]|uniref:DUF6699 domain-containing protein n=1 Tax=Marasmiellus scandens TaxID=2682957 RepID=A0ABR1JC57_9AGAR